MNHFPRLFRNCASLSSFFAALAISQSCTTRFLSAEEDSEGSTQGHPPPKPQNQQKTLVCNTSSKSKQVTLPGYSNPIEYRNSSEINYFAKGWESRIPVAASNFGLEDTGRISIAAIDIRNVGGVPHYLYYLNKGGRTQHENWSATKSIAIVSAMNRIRTFSEGKVGAMSRVRGTNITKDLRELVAEVHLQSDNNSATTFKDLGNRAGVTKFFNGWLNLEKPERFDGTHGGAAKVTGPYVVSSLKSADTVSLPLDPWPPGATNFMSPLALVEALKRVAVNSRDEKLLPRRTLYNNGPLTEEQAANLPSGLTNDDLSVLFYGDELSSNAPWTGMTYDGYGIELYALPALGGKGNADQKTNGRWRVFSKTGTGTSYSRGVTEAAYLAHICLPEFDGGHEIAFFMHIALAPGETSQSARARVTNAIVSKLVPGFK
jgi:hypothetical protein